MINNYYEFYGYRQFANFVQKNIDQYTKHESGDKLEMLKQKYIKDVFSNKILIIDEVHNIRDNNKSKGIVDVLNMITKYSVNLILKFVMRL